jgi:hypothetical protein
LLDIEGSASEVALFVLLDLGYILEGVWQVIASGSLVKVAVVQDTCLPVVVDQELSIHIVLRTCLRQATQQTYLYKFLTQGRRSLDLDL